MEREWKETLYKQVPKSEFSTSMLSEWELLLFPLLSHRGASPRRGGEGPMTHPSGIRLTGSAVGDIDVRHIKAVEKILNKTKSESESDL